MHRILSAVCLMLLLTSAGTDAAVIQLPRTGQTKCYDAGTVVSCAGTGQDGEMQAGVAWPNPRFTAGTGTQSECITDNLTGLTWMKTPDNTGRTWQQALDFSKASTPCGLPGWRLPSILELESLVHMGFNTEICGEFPCDTNSSWLMLQGFANVPAGINQYWSSTSGPTFTPGEGNAWVLQVGTGYLRFELKTLSTNKFVWLVRDSGSAGTATIRKTGQTACYDTQGGIVACSSTAQDGELRKGAVWPNPRFTVNGNGTVTDNLTGMVWLQDMNCFDGQTWANALNAASGLASGSCSLTDGSTAGRWRLPNRRELLSLVSFEFSTPSLPNTSGTGQWTTGNPFDNYDAMKREYWTSTMFDFGYVTFPGIIDINIGMAIYDVSDPYGASNFVWPVRDKIARQLIVEKAGSGSGTVTGSSGGIHCGQTCSASFPEGAIVNFSIFPGSAPSYFAGWSGDGDCSDGQVTMIAARTCTANFSLCQSQDSARISDSTRYPDIAGAFANAANPDEIHVLGTTLAESPDLSGAKNVALRGGYDCNFAPVPSAYTIISGTVTVSAGATITFDHIVIM